MVLNSVELELHQPAYTLHTPQNHATMKSLLIKYMLYRNLGPDRKSLWPLHDKDRMSAFDSAIKGAVSSEHDTQRSSSNVADIGSGTGVHACSALRHGASSAVVVERLKPVRAIVEQLAEANAVGEGSKVQVVEEADYSLPIRGSTDSGVDVIVVDVPGGHLLRKQECGGLGAGLVAALGGVGAGVRQVVPARARLWGMLVHVDKTQVQPVSWPLTEVSGGGRKEEGQTGCGWGVVAGGYGGR